MRVGQRVRALRNGEWKHKGVVSFVPELGSPKASPGTSIGAISVTFDDAVGRNNGTLDGKEYFTCPDQHGAFINSVNFSVW